MKIAVCGSGIIGVSSAWWLACDGHEVEVIDRRSGPAQETSKANGGQISVCYAEPWANTHTLRKVLRWLGRRDAPLMFRSEERRVGKEWVSTGRSRWWPSH